MVNAHTIETPCCWSTHMNASQVHGGGHPMHDPSAHGVKHAHQHAAHAGAGPGHAGQHHTYSNHGGSVQHTETTSTYLQVRGCESIIVVRKCSVAPVTVLMAGRCHRRCSILTRREALPSTTPIKFTINITKAACHKNLSAKLSSQLVPSGLGLRPPRCLQCPCHFLLVILDQVDQHVLHTLQLPSIPLPPPNGR